MPKKPMRDKKGRYDFSNMDLVCKCGHKLGVHAGQNEGRNRPCFNEDHGIDGATGEPCNCKNFQESKA